MEHNPKTKHPIRCYCSRKPLLAFYGIHNNGQPYVHVKVFKQDRLFGEVLSTGGTVRIRCRECLRWHKIVFRDSEAELNSIRDPDYI